MSRHFSFRNRPTRFNFSHLDSVADQPYPTLTNNCHDEVELVAALHKGSCSIPIDKALDCVFGYALALDMTRRDLQHGMGDQTKPW